jgi:hypothetical protein
MSRKKMMGILQEFFFVFFRRDFKSRFLRFLQRIYWRYYYWKTQRHLERLRRSGATDYRYPGVNALEKYDDASLFVEVSQCAAERCSQDGFDSLNESEKVLHSLYEFDAEVNNGGFGQWLSCACPNTIIGTLTALKTVGASEMADFVYEICLKLDNLNSSMSLERWNTYLESLPDSFHESLEPLSLRFGELEPEFLRFVYIYTRKHWRAIRPPERPSSDGKQKIKPQPACPAGE